MSEQPAPTIHEQIRRVVLQLFPWAAFFFLDTASKDLVVRAASGKIHLAGDATDPPVARTGDGAGQLRVVQNPTSGAVLGLFWRAKDGDSWVQVVGGLVPVLGPAPSDPGTPIYITTGSAKVTCR